MLKITTLDLATCTGFASGVADGEPRFGSFTMPSTGDDIGAFAVAFDEKLRDLLTFEAPDLVVFEAPLMRGDGKSTISTARKLMGLAYHTELVCKLLRLQCREGNLMTVKAFFAGHGRADKIDMKGAALAYGWKTKTSDEADALGLWCYSVFKKYPELGARFKHPDWKGEGSKR